jgi:hypothetical protein
MNFVLITNGKDFFDITDLIPKMMEYGHTRQESIEKLMEIDNCHLIAEGQTFEETIERLLT